MKIRHIGAEVSSLLSSCNTATIEGDGLSEDSAFLICTEAQLRSMDNAVNGVYFKLMTDLTLSSTYVPITGFKGNFNGNSKTISNLMIYAPKDEGHGLFDALDDGANVHDLVIADSVVQNYRRAGILAGSIGKDWISQVLISNITIKNSVVASYNTAGAISGSVAMADLSNIQVMNTTVLSEGEAGLISGADDGGGVNVNGAILQGYVSCPSYAGGVFGYSGEGTLENIAVNVNLSMPPTDNFWFHRSVGLFTGYTWGGGPILSVIKNSYAVGRNVNEKSTDTNYIGGFAGGSDGTIYQNVYVASSNLSQPIGGMFNTAGFLGGDWGGNDLTGNVYMYAHNNTFTEPDLNVIQLDDTQMKSSANLAGFNFSNTWQMATETQFKYPILQSQETSPAFSEHPTRVKSSGAVWIEEVPDASGNTFEKTTSSEFHYANLTLHNDSGSSIRLSEIKMAMSQSFLIASGTFAGTCSWLLATSNPTLANGGSCTIGIRFNPEHATSASEIDRDALLVSFILSGVKETIPHLVEGEAALDGPYIANAVQWPGTVIIGQTGTFNVNLTNDGVADGEIVSYSMSGDPEITFDDTNCPVGTIIAPSTSCTASINVSPTAIQTYSASLLITYRDMFGGADKTATVTFNVDGVEHPFDNTGTAPCLAGNGTALNPFCVFDTEELAKVRDSYQYSSTTYFIQTADIDMAPLGCNGFAVFSAFYPVYDGQGFKISNICANGPTGAIGLIIHLYGTFKNVLFDNLAVGAGSDGQWVWFTGNLWIQAGVVGMIHSGAVLQGVTVDGVVDGTANGHGWQGGSGGIVGNMEDNGQIIDCHSNVTLLGIYRAGGLVGFTGVSTVTDSSATGNVSGPGLWVGGLIGFAHTSTNIIRSYATGNVSGGGQIGGLVGVTIGNVIVDSYATGNVTSTGGSVGGFVGQFNNGSTATNCYATGAVSGTSELGGFAGAAYIGFSIPGAANVMTNVYATGSVTGTSNIGGLVGLGGYVDRPLNVTMSYATGNVFATTSNAGGLIGNLSPNSWVTKSFSKGMVDGSGTANFGGFVGTSDSASITDSFVINAEVLADNANYVGGFSGYSSNTTFSHCYAMNGSVGAASATNWAGFAAGDSGTSVFTENYFFNNGTRTVDSFGNTHLDNSGAATYVDGLANYVGFDSATPVWRSQTAAATGAVTKTPMLDWACALPGFGFTCQ